MVNVSDCLRRNSWLAIISIYTVAYTLAGVWDECLKFLHQKPNIIIKTLGIALKINPSLKKWLTTKKNKTCTDIIDINKMKSNVKLIMSRVSHSLSGE